MEEDFFIIRPATGQNVPLGKRSLPDPRPDIFPSNLTVGLVISTYAGAPFVELGLAVRKALYPDLPTLVHDDTSGRAEQLAELCNRYGADFETNSSRLGHQMGDLSALVGGLEWAAERKIDLLVKMSRRFIPLTDWVTDLTQLALASQYPTYANLCRFFSLPIRTECMAVAVGEWRSPDVAGEIRRFMLQNLEWTMAETYLVDFARKVESRRCDAARAWTARTPETSHLLGYATWDFVAPSRTQQSRNHLWHTANGPEAYAGAARNLGLSLGIEDFKANPDVAPAT